MSKKKCSVETLPDGSKSWWKNGKRHRKNGPARTWPDGTEFWYKHGEIHRKDGPAVTWEDGGMEWWYNDHQYITMALYVEAAGMCEADIVILRLRHGQ